MARRNPPTFYHISFPNGEGDLLGAIKALIKDHFTFTYSAMRNDICLCENDTDIKLAFHALAPFYYTCEKEEMSL